MTTTPDPLDQGTSTRPYLIRALHDWCTDNGFTPYIAVFVDASVQVPAEYVKNDEIVLNIGFDATNGLELGNQSIVFKARFGGRAREIAVPVDHVVAIYARENGQGMAFPAPACGSPEPASSTAAEIATDAAPGLRLARPTEPATPEGPAPSGLPEDNPPPSRPTLKRIK